MSTRNREEPGTFLVVIDIAILDPDSRFPTALKQWHSRGQIYLVMGEDRSLEVGL